VTVTAPANGRFWRGYVTTLRPYLMFGSGAAGLVGLALADMPAWRLLLGGVVLFVVYGLGQALTDVFQTDTDRLSAPERPLVRGTIRRDAVLAASLGGLGACALIIAWLNPWTLIPSAAGIVLLATYTPMKRRWWAGPPWNAAVVALLPLLGRLCAGGTLVTVLAERPVRLAMGSAFGTYAVFVVLGYLKDVEADRATGYATIAVRFGRRAAVAAGALCASFGLACSWVLVAPGVPDASSLLWYAGAGAIVAAHALLWSNARDEEAWPGVVASVIGFVALHLGEVAMLRPAWLPATVALLVLAVTALWLRPNRRQI
jgi:4-hydroxybenzoate polyprenyltransferase